LRGRTKEPVRPFGADADACYAAVYELDVSGLEPQVACPHEIDNVRPVSEIGDVPVQEAFIGSCTNSRLEDLERAAAILRGRRVSPGTRLLVVPSSREIYTQIERSGALRAFLEAGAMMLCPCCGPCGGAKMGVLAAGETAISSANRNFKGRMGSPESFVYVASPETVAASAIAGRIVDPRKYLQ
jgi:3-isopropylmalate/(R)-2-methylmalate dehydratase large subunit